MIKENSTWQHEEKKRKEKKKTVTNIKIQLIKLKKVKLVKKQYLFFVFPRQTVFRHRLSKEEKKREKEKMQLKD